jgi:hypothetical protein
MKYEVYKSDLSEVVIFETDNLNTLLEYGTKNKIGADQVTVNGLVAYGWDEIESRMLENL